MAETKKKEYQPPSYIKFVNDGSKAELIPNPRLTPKGVYTYKYYFSEFQSSTLIGTTIPFDEETIKRMISRNTITVLNDR